jgi:type IV secretory pathway TraG/TraD family ATPase VirD4
MQDLPARLLDDLWGWSQRLQELTSEHPYAAITVVAAILLASWVVGTLRRQSPDGPHARKRGFGASRAARWVRRARFKPLVARIFPRGAHAYGVLGREYPAEFGVVYGGTGSGKTLRIVVPHVARLVLSRLCSVVVNDPKGEILDLLWKLLGDKGGNPPVYLLSTLRKHPDELVGVVNPIGERASRMNFAEAILPDPPNGDPSWNQRARAMILAVADAVDDLLDDGEADLPKVYEALKDTRKLDGLARMDPRVGSVWAGQDNRTHESVRTTALAPLLGLEDPRIRRLFDASRAATAEEAAGPSFERRELVWICLGEDDIQRAGPLAAATIDYLRTRAMHRRGGPEVEMVVEEAGTCFPNHKLDTYVNYGRGFGVRTLLVYQDHGQLEGVLGHHRAGSVVGAMELQVYGPTRSVATARLLQELAGTTRVTRKTPRVVPSFFDYLFGNAKPQEQRAYEEEVPRVRAEHLYRLNKGRFFVLCAPETLELVKARRALWPKYARRVLPKDPGAVNLVRPSHPDRLWYPAEPDAEEESEPAPARDVEPPEEPDREEGCPVCGEPVAAGARECGGCGASL